jgi:hypothetical protein
MSKTPEILWGASRQHRHNFESEEFIPAFDYEETIKIVQHLQATISKQAEEIERLKKDKYELLNVKSKDGILSSEWLMRTATAEGENTTLKARVAELEGKCEEFEAMEEKLDKAIYFLVKYRNGTPLGNQPHMMCHAVDEFLNSIKPEEKE